MSISLCFVVNDLRDETADYTTTLLAVEALRRGHQVSYATVDDFSCAPDAEVHVHARRPVPARLDGPAMVAALQRAEPAAEPLCAAELDVLMLRNEPSREPRSWARTTPLSFARHLLARGVLVLNDPDGLWRNYTKLYVELLPEQVRPRTLVSRNVAELRRFITAHHDYVVLKPLQGSRGQGVFVVRDHDPENVHQMIDAVTRDGYVIAQEYLPLARRGDIRLLTLDGEPLRVDGQYAAFRREPSDGDLRSNVHAGGVAVPAEVTAETLAVAGAVRDRLRADGIFLAGLDIVGDKLLEINVFSPGGLYNAARLQGVDFAPAVVDALEAKVAHARRRARRFDNRELAVWRP